MLCFGILLMVCQQPAPPPVSDVARFCALAKPIYWSRKDTPETAAAVKQHNAMGAKLCAWGKPAQKAK